MKRFECSGVLFDLDGVLVDSAAYVEQQWRRWASTRGLRPEPFLRVCHGRRALETIRMAAPHLDAEAEVRAFAPIEDASTRIGPVAGALRLLAALPANGWAVATSGLRSTAASRLRQAGLPAPSVLICAEDVAHGKPSPDAYQLAARALGLGPHECVVIEDAPAGIQAARAAEMAVIALTTTHSLDQLPADACATSLLGVHLGRVHRRPDGRDRMELLVVEA